MSVGSSMPSSIQNYVCVSMEELTDNPYCRGVKTGGVLVEKFQKAEPGSDKKEN